MLHRPVLFLPSLQKLQSLPSTLLVSVMISSFLQNSHLPTMLLTILNSWEQARLQRKSILSWADKHRGDYFLTRLTKPQAMPSYKDTDDEPSSGWLWVWLLWRPDSGHTAPSSVGGGSGQYPLHRQPGSLKPSHSCCCRRTPPHHHHFCSQPFLTSG